jgi:predicted HTH domain antitoxin
MLQIEIRSPDLEKEVNALIDSGLYPDPHAVIIDALENLVETKKASRLNAAIQSYRKGEVTLGRAAELAGMHRFEFEEILKVRGIVKEVEVDSVEELEAGVSVIKSLHTSNERPEEP